MKNRMRAGAAGVTMLLASATPSSATTYQFAIDVPATLGAADYVPGDVVRSAEGLYGLELPLGPVGALAALGRRADGRWLLVPAQPVSLSSGTADPRDVLLLDGASVSKLVDGQAAGIPEGVGLDAVFPDPAGDLVVSFDTPVELEGVAYAPSDLALWSAGHFTPYWSAGAAGVPAGSDVTGAALSNDGTLLLTFDVPTALSGLDSMPGTVVAFEQGTTFAPFVVDPLWPVSAHLTGFTIAPVGAGEVPDGGPSEPPLTVNPAGGGDITLSWAASCAPTDLDYEVYEGTIGSYYSHTPRSCSTGGATTLTLTPAGASRYYLVVPRNLQREGSYGTDSAGVARPASPSACLIQQVAPCP